MARAVLPGDYSGLPDGEPLVIELKQPWLAALLAWALPGLGHLYQGRTAKGLLFFACIVGTFVYGMYIGGGKVVYASMPGQDPWRWQYYCQAGIGLPAMPALIQRSRAMSGQPPLWGGLMAPPSSERTPLVDDSGKTTTQPNELAAWIVAMHPRHELGTVFTVIAGLLNLLVICDAYAGPLVLRAPVKGEAPEGAGADGSQESSPSAADDFTSKPTDKPADRGRAGGSGKAAKGPGKKP
jgi:hypothetical protein